MSRFEKLQLDFVWYFIRTLIMKQLKDHIIPQGDDFSVSYKIAGADGKNLVFSIKDGKEELYTHPMEIKGNDVYHVECDSDAFGALDKGDYTYSIRIEDKPRTTIGKGSLTIE